MEIKFVALGGYDDSKPRVRLLLGALRKRGALAGEIHIDVWRGLRDKSSAGLRQIVFAGLRLLFGFPRALIRLAAYPSHFPVLLPYPGTPEIFAVAVLSKLSGRTIVLDAFLPLHDTIVGDRDMIAPNGLLSKLLSLVEKAGLRLADYILVDTDAQGVFLQNAYDLDPGKFNTVLVGAEPLFDPRAAMAPVDDLLERTRGRKIVLFYGQLIPLHGLSTILEATRLTDPADVCWLIVGEGQDQPILEDFLEDTPDDTIIWVPWVNYDRLPSLIAKANVCLGVFGSSDKAARVIPNKVFQQLAMGKTVITRSGPAMSPLASQFPEAIRTVPPNDPKALAEQVNQMLAERQSDGALPSIDYRQLSPVDGIDRLIRRLHA